MRHSGGVTHTVGSVEVESLEQFDRLRSRSRSMAGWFVQDLDLRDRSEALLTARPQGAVFLGCQMARHVEDSLRDRGALLFPGLVGLPFDPYRARLYTAAELYGDVAGGGAYTDSPDARSNAWRLAQGTPPDVAATLAMSLHDPSIGDALMDAVDRIDRAHVVGVMGGHDVVRGSRTYEDAAKLGLALTRAGMTVFTGGGPGAMEAVNLGARMAAAPDELEDVLATLAAVPTFLPSVDAWARVPLAHLERHPCPRVDARQERRHRSQRGQHVFELVRRGGHPRPEVHRLHGARTAPGEHRHPRAGQREPQLRGILVRPAPPHDVVTAHDPHDMGTVDPVHGVHQCVADRMVMQAHRKRGGDIRRCALSQPPGIAAGVGGVGVRTAAGHIPVQLGSRVEMRTVRVERKAHESREQQRAPIAEGVLDVPRHLTPQEDRPLRPRRQQCLRAVA